MFTGIVEAVGTVEKVEEEGSNKHFTVKAPFVAELQIDQSISHNGVCLTVVEVHDNSYKVTAIKETLEKSNLARVSVGDLVNLERCVKVGDRLDGHIVQGHVDNTAECSSIEQLNGSWYFHFMLPKEVTHLIVKKGSITVNGISLTIADVNTSGFSVAIIPYTYQHTNLQQLKSGYDVNIEFDVVGKYVASYMDQLHHSN